MEAYEFPEEVVTPITLRTEVGDLEFPEIGEIVELNDPKETRTFKVLVGHQQVDQPLFARWQLVSGEDRQQLRLLSNCVEDPAAGRFVDESIPTNGMVERTYSFTVIGSSFSTGCHAIELAVSPSFRFYCNEVRDGAPTFFANGEGQAPVAVARWYVFVDGVSTGCPRDNSGSETGSVP